MAELFIEVAPGNEIFRGRRQSRSRRGCRPRCRVVEREFGLLEIHFRAAGEVLGRRRCSPGLPRTHRGGSVEAKIASAQFITNVSPYQAQC